MAFAASRGHRQRPQIVIAAGRLGRRRQGEPRSRSYPRRRASVRPVVPGGKAGRGRRCQAGGKADRRQTGGRQVAGGKAARKRKTRVCMYEKFHYSIYFSFVPALYPALSPLCPRQSSAANPHGCWVSCFCPRVPAIFLFSWGKALHLGHKKATRPGRLRVAGAGFQALRLGSSITSAPACNLSR